MTAVCGRENSGTTHRVKMSGVSSIMQGASALCEWLRDG